MLKFLLLNQKPSHNTLNFVKFLATSSNHGLNNKSNTLQGSKSLLFSSNTRSDYNQIQTRTILRGGNGYSNYGHGRPKEHFTAYGRFYQFFLFTAFIITFFPSGFLGKWDEPTDTQDDSASSSSGKLQAETIDSTDETSPSPPPPQEKKKKSKKSKKDPQDGNDENKEDDEATTEASGLTKKKHVSFRDKKIIEYENRIRHYSTPDKTFRYFATLKVWNEMTNDYEIFMKPEDFVRSLTFGAKQPEGRGLDSYIRYEPNMHKLEINLPTDSVFYHLGQQGLISFTDYLFLLTLLSIPTRHFEIAFKMFDIDGNGNIDVKEFENLQEVIRKNTQFGARHRDTTMTGSVIKENSALNKYFFGNDRKGLLTVERFTKFQKQLQSELVKMEFDRNDPINGKITDIAFCETLVSYAGFNETRTKKMLKRVAKKFKESDDASGITLKEFEDFFHVLRSIQDIDTALKFYSLAGASIDHTILKHVAKTVSGVYLTDHLVDVVFCLFDDNGDGKLSHQEFINVMKKRWLRGLQNPKDTGFIRFVHAFYACSKETIKSRYLY